MNEIRDPAVAGMFYPDDPDLLESQVLEFLLGRSGAPTNGKSHGVKAIIVPHAGYVYSGECAGKAYREFWPDREAIRRIVLLGPSHRVPVRGLATTGAKVWRTPLGDIPIDRAALDSLSDLPQVHVDDTAHAQEHSLEVQLPFLQEILSGFTLVPFAVGSASAEEVAQVLDRLWGGEETRVVISTDLSHYNEYDAACAIDGRTAEAVECLDWCAIGPEQACGRVPMSGLLSLAQRRNLHVHRLQLCNSGDTFGPHDRVVGYGAWALG